MAFIRIPLFSLFFSLVLTAAAAQLMTPEDYINTYKEAAIQNMFNKKIPASITLAQGMLESGNGNSVLAKKANNHFGIKCHNDWKGKTMHMDDDRRNECFRKYPSVLDSYADHADFLANRERYKDLFTLDITDYKGWARGLKKAGYATANDYADKLISLIERHSLQDFDKLKPNGINLTPRLAERFKNNGLQAVRAKDGDTPLGLSLSLDVKLKKIYRYNELGKGDKLREGQVLYLQPKRYRAAKGLDYHTVKEGETIYQIAQFYGIKTTALLKKNNMWYASEIKPGDVLHLRKQKPL